MMMMMNGVDVDVVRGDVVFAQILRELSDAGLLVDEIVG